ncbi:MAG TPA: serine/threonine-protein kinase, partial [Rudaea sp.]
MTQTQADWEHIKTLFEACRDSAPDERACRLDAQAGVTPHVRAEVEALLRAHDRAAVFDDGAAAWGAALFGDDEPRMPERIGPYRLLRELGRGGMGVVWLAERDEQGLRQRVALKRIRTGLDGSELRARFRRERGILARLNHDRIARLLDGGVDAEQRPWFALEYVAGEPITRWCDARRLPLRARVRLFLDVLDGVAYAHRNLVVHRDLKSANVLVDGDGHIKLLDFGIAKLVADDENTDRTATGALVLTPTSAAPEQVRGEAVSTATDIYALGVLLYELATGVLPYRADPASRHALARAAVDEAVERSARALARTGVDADALATARGTTAHALRRELDRGLDQIFAIALAKAPEARYVSADAFAADLRAWLEHRPLLSRPTPRWQRVRKFVRRHRVGVAAAALIAICAISGVAATIWQMHASERHAATERAVREFTTNLFAAIDPEQARGREVPLREVLDEGARRAASDLADQPATRGALLSDLGAIYGSLGDTATAVRLLDQAREALLAAPQRDDDELARAWLRLAGVQTEASRFKEAAGSADASLQLLQPRPVTFPLRAQAELQRA